MSSKNIQIPYQLLSQGEQTISYPADTLYCQTMNAPADITLDLYLNNSKVEEKTIKPNYEMNLDNINIDEVIVKMIDNGVKFSANTTYALPTLSGGNIYQITATDNYIYLMTHTYFYQFNLNGSIYKSVDLSSLPLLPTNNFVGYNPIYFTIVNNNIYIPLVASVGQEVNHMIIYTFDINCNLLRYKDIYSSYTSNGLTSIYSYNNKIFIGNDGSPSQVYVYDLNCNYIFSFSPQSSYFSFSGNNIVSLTDSSLTQISLDTYNSIGSIDIGTTNAWVLYLLYSQSANLSYCLYLNIVSNVLSINSFVGDNISQMTSALTISLDNITFMTAFEKFGYLVLITNNGISIYNGSLQLVYSNNVSISGLIGSLPISVYLTSNSSNIYYISGTSTLNILNYNIKQPVNNPLYPADFNLILGCKC